jgi:hypothetical protein
MMKLSDRAALLRQAAAAMDELKRLCQAEGGHGHSVTCCERMAEACRDAAAMDEQAAAMIESRATAESEEQAATMDAREIAEAEAAKDNAGGED